MRVPGEEGFPPFFPWSSRLFLRRSELSPQIVGNVTFLRWSVLLGRREKTALRANLSCVPRQVRTLLSGIRQAVQSFFIGSRPSGKVPLLRSRQKEVFDLLIIAGPLNRSFFPTGVLPLSFANKWHPFPGSYPPRIFLPKSSSFGTQRSSPPDC